MAGLYHILYLKTGFMYEPVISTEVSKFVFVCMFVCCPFHFFERGFFINIFTSGIFEHVCDLLIF